MKDGLVLFYLKDGQIYPIAMSEQQMMLLQALAPAIFGDEPIKVIDKPQGNAIDLSRR